MLTRSTVEKLIPILQRDARRSIKMYVPGFPRPYYCSLLLRDVHWFNTWASSGSTYRQKSDRSRNVYCDLRVGSYAYDQVIDGGLHDNDEESESTAHSAVPIDDKDYDGLRMALWRLLEAKFKEALTEYNRKESDRIATVDPNHGLKSFTRYPKTISKKLSKLDQIDTDKWTKFCKKASLWMSRLPRLSGSSVDFDATQETRIFVNTEGSVIVQNHQIFSLTATFKKLAKDGTLLSQELVINCGKESELPSMKEFKKLAMKKFNQLMQLTKADKIHAFSGPVLLYPEPAGLLFHEAIGHRLEGSRLLSNSEGQTFKDQIGKQILNTNLTVRDDPSLKSFNDKRCVGAYDFDDEGVKAQNAVLIKEGLLTDFLSTRSAITAKRGYHSNGHARALAHQRPISRMAVTIVEGDRGVSIDQLKQRLLHEIKRQKKPFGMIVYETSGGETDTTNYDFQAFAGEICYATLIYPNGKEVCVRGVNFVGTPLQSLNNIIAYGNELEIDNGHCGAESGFLPVTTISPAVLISSLELQGKDEEIRTQFILPRPKFTKVKKRGKKKSCNF